MASSRADMLKAFRNSRKKKPPRRNWRVTGSIPGFGEAQQTQQAKAYADAQAQYDTTTRPRYGAQRAPYYKGQRFKRKHPYRYQRGDARRPHMPRLD
jgi:hypothetical protein